MGIIQHWDYVFKACNTISYNILRLTNNSIVQLLTEKCIRYKGLIKNLIYLQ